MQIQPYVFFEGRCEEALMFYRDVLGAEITQLMRYSDSPAPPPPGMLPPGSENRIMHASMRIGDSTVMVSDGNCSGTTGFSGFSLALNAASDAEAERLFAALAEGGQIRMPMAPTFFSSRFGMLADRYGLGWMVLVPA
ncbi:VOC family protein [Noviherbaspirillum sp. 1P10PC]|uniref:VOC family protein n=1 Tax=Noviherbaspirillum sp. 1P10PC TaxID=3132292 RepID=UPI00399FCF30